MKNRVPFLAIDRTLVFGLALAILLILPIGAKTFARTHTSVPDVVFSQPVKTVASGSYNCATLTVATPVPPSIVLLPGSSIIELTQQPGTTGTPVCAGTVVVNTLHISVDNGTFYWVNTHNGQMTTRKLILVR